MTNLPRQRAAAITGADNGPWRIEQAGVEGETN
jgi:hypothetical protein